MYNWTLIGAVMFNRCRIPIQSLPCTKRYHCIDEDRIDIEQRCLIPEQRQYILSSN